MLSIILTLCHNEIADLWIFFKKKKKIKKQTTNVTNLRIDCLHKQVQFIEWKRKR